MGLGWWCKGVQFPHLDVSLAQCRQERGDLESTTLLVLQSVSGTSSHANTKAQGTHRRVLSVSLCRLDAASFSIAPLQGDQIHHSISHPSVVGGCSFPEVGGIQGGRRTCQMLSWPWEGATHPTTVFRAAMTMLLTHGTPRVMCRESGLDQVKDRKPQAG